MLLCYYAKLKLCSSSHKFELNVCKFFLQLKSVHKRNSIKCVPGHLRLYVQIHSCTFYTHVLLLYCKHIYLNWMNQIALLVLVEGLSKTKSTYTYRKLNK